MELREGTDLTLVSSGIMTVVAMEVAEELGREGIRARVLHVHTVKPIDEEAIVKAAREDRSHPHRGEPLRDRRPRRSGLRSGVRPLPRPRAPGRLPRRVRRVGGR